METFTKLFDKPAAIYQCFDRIVNHSMFERFVPARASGLVSTNCWEFRW
jgi:hypothetical protein